MLRVRRSYIRACTACGHAPGGAARRKQRSQGRACMSLMHWDGAGHIHRQGHHVDERGVHYINMPALLETPPQQDACHAVMHVYEDGFLLEGRGACESIAGRRCAALEA